MSDTPGRKLPEAPQTEEERRTHDSRKDTGMSEFITLTKAPDRGSIAVADKVGLLARNIFAALPIPSPEQWVPPVKIYALLTVARQPVICTRFPVISLYAKPCPVMKKRRTEKV